METAGRGVLDTPLEPVVGLAEGETWWRGMTARKWAKPETPTDQLCSLLQRRILI
jgi:hypothetical protein